MLPGTPGDIRLLCIHLGHLIGVRTRGLGLLVEDRIRHLEHAWLDLGTAYGSVDYLSVAIVDQIGVAGVFGSNARETEYLGLESVVDGHFVRGVVKVR